MTFKLGSKSKAQAKGVRPDLIAVVEGAILITPQDFSLHSGLRTTRQQKVLYNRGASQRDGVNRLSAHQKQSDGFGHAVDLVPYVSGQGLRWEWSLIYPIAASVFITAQEKGLELIWGGVWDRHLSTLSKKCRTLDEVANDMKTSVHAYTVRHPGPDFIDGPHYEIAS